MNWNLVSFAGYRGKVPRPLARAALPAEGFVEGAVRHCRAWQDFMGTVPGAWAGVPDRPQVVHRPNEDTTPAHAPSAATTAITTATATPAAATEADTHAHRSGWAAPKQQSRPARERSIRKSANKTKTRACCLATGTWPWSAQPARTLWHSGYVQRLVEEEEEEEEKQKKINDIIVGAAALSAHDPVPGFTMPLLDSKRWEWRSCFADAAHSATTLRLTKLPKRLLDRQRADIRLDRYLRTDTIQQLQPRIFQGSWPQRERSYGIFSEHIIVGRPAPTACTSSSSSRTSPTSPAGWLAGRRWYRFHCPVRSRLPTSPRRSW